MFLSTFKHVVYTRPTRTDVYRGIQPNIPVTTYSASTSEHHSCQNVVNKNTEISCSFPVANVYYIYIHRFILRQLLTVFKSELHLCCFVFPLPPLTFNERAPAPPLLITRRYERVVRWKLSHYEHNYSLNKICNTIWQAVYFQLLYDGSKNKLHKNNVIWESDLALITLLSW